MKKYSWIVALLLALTLAFVGCPDPKDDPEPPPPPPPPPTGGFEEIEVAFTSANLAGGGGATAVPTDEGDGFVFTFGSQGHGNTKVAFKVDLGTTQVRSYEKVTFTFKGISGDLGATTGEYNDGPKGLTLLAAGTQTALTGYLGDDALVAAMVNNWPASGTAAAATGPNICANGALIGAPADWPKEMEIAISPTRPRSTLTGEVWFSIYLHANPVGTINGTSEPTSFEITNVVFVPYEGEVDFSEPVDIAAIAGVAAPVRDAAPVTAITATDQFTGTVAWTPAVSGTFAAATAYTATITLTAKEGFTFTGVEKDFFTVAGATSVSNDADSGVVTAVFPATAAVGQDTIINILAIEGVTAPVAGATPVATITETTQYTGTVAWAPTVSGTFDFETDYTATITLTAKTGFTLTGVAANAFTVAGASATNAAGAGVVTAVFPATLPDVATALTITVDGVEYEVGIGAFGATAELLPDGSGYTVTDVNYGNAYAYFQADLGTETLSDFTQLAFKWKGIEGDIGYKSVNLFASDTEFNAAVATNGTLFLGSASFQSTNTSEQSGTFYFLSSSTESKPYIALVMWGAKTSSGTTEPLTLYEVYDLEFIKGTKYTVTLDADGGTVDTTTLTIVDGGKVGTLPTATKAGFNFGGWFLPDGTTEITATTDVDSALSGVTLKAKWSAAVSVSGFTVDFTGMTFRNATGGATIAIETDGSGYTYTYGNGAGNNYSLAPFEVDLETGASLADYTTVTFTLLGLAGDFNYKGLMLLDSQTVNAGGFNAANLAVTNTVSSGDSSAGVEIVLTIDKAKAGALTGTIEVAIYMSAGATLTGDTVDTSYKITNVVFE